MPPDQIAEGDDADDTEDGACSDAPEAIEAALDDAVSDLIDDRNDSSSEASFDDSSAKRKRSA